MVKMHMILRLFRSGKARAFALERRFLVFKGLFRQKKDRALQLGLHIRDKDQAPSHFSHIWRFRGPSASKNHTACHVPTRISPSSTMS